ncbi:LLM class flavin-dependent oxidoreductase [Pseudonocardia xinjiangensis]|uniref:LLM class flavin-dependent oxidoreductase n=1 Tax=Pseudonocardia xinjiangensis TaxID=75289 RepID=A0ABX1RKI1_9PSEU|nr:LLM class flavin-dependent oxidoreductase [Pseudonocardia xinjiangensis]NMH79900.1 LLM class flavin-dependent oxidoreductase [Pseudonocardia xinjiangensis]
MGRSTYLAVEVSGAGRHPAAWLRPDAQPDALLTAPYHVGLARLAARAGADFLAVPDSLAPPSADPRLVPLRLDAVAIAARVAPVVPGVGLVPTVTVTHTEPFHVSKAIATLDLVSSGRAGWEPVVSRTAAEAELFGRKPAAPPAELWREAVEVVDVVVALWDSWEDDAVIRDVATGRYVDRDKLHYIDFSGEFFSVKGPSITPRSPQAHPLVVVRGDEPEALAVAAARADVVRVAAADLATAHTARERVRAAVAAAGRDPDAVAVLLDVEVLLGADAGSARRELDALDAHRELAPSSLRVVDTAATLVDVITDAVAGGAADGVTAVPLALPSGVRAIAADVAPRLADRGLRTPVAPGATLRDRFGLARPANRFEGARA